MSYGIVICSECKREVHQGSWMVDRAWVHCDDSTVICQSATAVYPKSKAEIKGHYCGKDDL